MGRYVGGKWREDLPSLSSADQVQWNNVPISSSSGGGGSAPAQTAPAVNAGGDGTPVYQTVNGPRTSAQMMNELFAAGWNGQGEIKSVYARTTGGTVTPSTGAGAGGGGSGAGGGGGSLSAQDKQDILNAFGQSSGFSLQQLAEQKRQFDLNLEWTKQMWANQGLPQLQIQQQAAQLARDQFNAQTELAKGNLALAQKAQAAQESQFGATMGLDYLKTAASMGGPADYFAQSNFLRGAAGNPAVPAFLSALQNNTGLASFNAPAGAAPAVQSAAGLAGRLTGAAAPINQQAALNTIGQIGAAGGQALAPQALEQLNPDEMNLLHSGLKASGFSIPSFLTSYQNSRIAQNAGQAA